MADIPERYHDTFSVAALYTRLRINSGFRIEVGGLVGLGETPYACVPMVPLKAQLSRDCGVSLRSVIR